MIETKAYSEENLIAEQHLQAPGQMAHMDYLVGNRNTDLLNAICYQMSLDPNQPILAEYATRLRIQNPTFLLQFGVTPKDQTPVVILCVGPLKQNVPLIDLGIDDTPPLNYSIHFNEDPKKQIVTMEIPAHTADANLLPLQTLFA